MKTLALQTISELRSVVTQCTSRSLAWLKSFTRVEQLCMFTSLFTTFLVCIFVLQLRAPEPVKATNLAELPTEPDEITDEPFFRIPIPPVLIDYTQPVREAPGSFRQRQKMPARPEGSVSLAIQDYQFDKDKDLVRIEDPRVWWESDNDDATNDTEDDHLMHRCVETPFRRLIELVDAEGGQIKVQDSYRAVGVHAPKSLHKQGRALDLTANDMSLSRLAQLCWAAGFDWVYYELRGGHHVHASKRPDER
jgi:hypothetical protein